MTLTAQDLVAREVHYCVSALVSTLANGYGLAQFDSGDLGNLSEQAFELATPIDDYEEAAIEAGAVHSGSMWSHDDHPVAETDASALCYALNIEPYQHEVFEHWIVSDWLADKLEANGEKVDKDFAGMTIWARTTTGQAIYADGVMEAIAAELNAAA